MLRDRRRGCPYPKLWPALPESPRPDVTIIVQALTLTLTLTLLLLLTLTLINRARSWDYFSRYLCMTRICMLSIGLYIISISIVNIMISIHGHMSSFCTCNWVG